MIRRGTFQSVRALEQAIYDWLAKMESRSPTIRLESDGRRYFAQGTTL
jgi:hypothetical protein